MYFPCCRGEKPWHFLLHKRQTKLPTAASTIYAFFSKLSLSLSPADHESQWGKLALATSLTSGFKILLVRVSDRRNDRVDDHWIPDHQLDYSNFTSNQFAWNLSDEWRVVWIGSWWGAYQFWLPQSGSGMTEDVQRIPDHQLDYSTLHSIAFLRIGSWRGVCQFWWPQSGPGIRRCKKQGGKLA